MVGIVQCNTLHSTMHSTAAAVYGVSGVPYHCVSACVNAYSVIRGHCTRHIHIFFSYCRLTFNAIISVFKFICMHATMRKYRTQLSYCAVVLYERLS